MLLKNNYFSIQAGLIALAVLSFLPAYATNGLKLVASGTRAVSMGGADIANSNDTSVLNVNPALITQFNSPRIDAHFANAFFLNIGHSDQFGREEVSNKNAQLLDLSFVSNTFNGSLYWGTGLFFTGGAGSEYDSINTPFGGRDELTSLIGLLSITPSVAYRFNDALSLGASLIVMYINAEQKFFPNTSVADPNNPAHTFFGTQFEDAEDTGYGIRLGSQYKVNDQLTLGAVYTSEIELNPESDRLGVNMSAIGLGQVNYKQLKLGGINFPQEIGLGLEYKFNSSLSIAMDISWLDWSSAVKRSTLVASQPDNPAAPATIENSADLRWKDQVVFALGLAYQYSPQIELRAGYNYARAPVRKETLSPLLSPHAEHHIGLGVGKTFNAGWRFDFAAVYVFNEKIRYTNPDLPFGPDAQEEGETMEAHFTLGYNF